ncbi:hypothetical protein [Prosthecomicrobium sp. N25]|uniref:hypothetical protein n=1 Tax=Prosthecomicrobium sp. N25 TaxID=3129254 RepID=UPI003077B73C
MSRSAEAKTLAAIAAVGLLLAGCSSDNYLDNRDTVTLQFGDAVAANKVAQTIDPWPPYVNDTRLPVNGQRAVASVERYKKGMILPPVPATTSELSDQSAAPPAGAAAMAK